MTVSSPLAAIVDEGRRVSEVALQAGLPLKITGGVAVALRCPSALSDAPLRREYADIDVVGRARDSGEIQELLVGLGYQPDTAFNAVHGSTRLYFWDPSNSRQLDVFLDQIEMCHRIDLRMRLETGEPTLTLADLLLMKLQVIETNHKDYVDILALLKDHEFSDDDVGINLTYLAKLSSQDWGLWRTTTMVAERAANFASSLSGFAEGDLISRQVARYVEAVEEIPKSSRWKMRAKVGERKRWYEVPEESH